VCSVCVFIGVLSLETILVFLFTIWCLFFQANAGEDKLPIVVVGNKTDLVGDGKREVTVAEGQRFAASVNAIFVESSAKTNENVQRVFELAVKEIEKQSGECFLCDYSRCSNLGFLPLFSPPFFHSLVWFTSFLCCLVINRSTTQTRKYLRSHVRHVVPKPTASYRITSTQATLVSATVV
jgi:hypothetical protein